MIDQGTCSVCRFDADEPEREPQIFRRIQLNVDMSPDDFVTTQVPLSAATRTATPIIAAARSSITNMCPESRRNSTAARMAHGSQCLWCITRACNGLATIPLSCMAMEVPVMLASAEVRRDSPLVMTNRTSL